ncbi:MAG: FMN-binding protein [Acidobacteriota bacterium]
MRWSERFGRARALVLVPAMIGLGTLLPGAVTPARVILSRDEALHLAFGSGAQVERRTAFLAPAELDRARTLAGPGVPIETAMVPRYIGHDGDRFLGVAYFDTHRVRTENETIMVVVSGDGRVVRVEIIAFGEPPDYLARPAWLRQFDDQSLGADLALDRDIQPMTGASLTARAVTLAVRRVLALHAVLTPAGDPVRSPREAGPR